MLSQILDYIHNYFIKEIFRGKFNVVNGELTTEGTLRENQYFYIKGSIFNDGLHQFPTSDMVDEEFDGEVWALAIPPALIELSKEVEDWVAKYGNVMNSPFNSESFGGYSYNKTTGNGSDKGNNASWQNVFNTRLNAYRKIS